jgi:flagellin-like protein
MNKSWLGIIGTVLVIVVIVWLVGGSRISCHDSFWDKDKKVIEINPG